MYSKEIIKRFTNAKNAGCLKNADGVGEVGNVRCGDILRVYIKVKDNKIIDAKFKTYGCVAAIASSDILCDMAKGKTLEEAEKITNKDVIDELGDMPSVKVHCSVMGASALKKAIEDYRNKK